MRLVNVAVTYPQTDPHHAVFETVSYSGSDGAEMIRFRWREEADDIFGAVSVAFSRDHGTTWADEQTWPSGEARPGGVYRQYWCPPVAVGNRLLLVGADGVFRRDHALDGMTQYTPRYRVSADGGRTWSVVEPVIQTGRDLDAAHPFPNVWVGRNAVMPANPPLMLHDGRVLVPCNVTTLGEDGRYFCPEGAYTFTSAGILEGRWRWEGGIDWTLREPVRLRPDQSLRGAIEPTLAEMPDGRILMVMRANAGTADPQLGCKWFSVSGDHGKTWSRPWPWTFSDGTPFYSPSSISQLFRHSSGEWYWIGNICPDPPAGNSPRYPLVMGRVDPVTLRLDGETLDVIDTRREGDSEQLQLSNFTLYEDRRTGDVILRLTRLDGGARGGPEPIRASVVAYTLDL
jgi:hypothetical protein